MSDVAKVKNIRAATGLSVGRINQALQEAGGDETKALAILESSGAVIAQKKSGREIKQGVVASYIHSNKKIGVLVVLGSETDFVARNPEFIALANDLAMQIAAMQPADLPELLAQPSIKDASVTVGDLITQAVAKLGENIQVGEFVRFSI